MPPKRGKKGAVKKAETEVVNSAANGTENDESPKNGETVEEEKIPEPATKGTKRSASANAKKGRKTKKTEEETNGEDAEQEPSTNQESSPRSTKRSAVKDESPKNIYGKKSKKTKKTELEKVDEDDNDAKDDEASETEESEEPSSTTAKKTGAKSKKKRDIAEENGTNVETISNRPKRKAAPPTVNVALKRTIPLKVVIKSKTKKKKASPSKPPAPPKEQFEVESIIQMREKSGKREFLVKWKGYGKNQNTWEPEKNLNCPKILATFLKKEGKSTSSN